MANMGELGVPEISVTIHDVTVCGTVIRRPPCIAPSQWLWFWNDANKFDAAVELRKHIRRY